MIIGFLLVYIGAMLTLLYVHTTKPVDPRHFVEVIRAQEEANRLIQKEAYDRFLEEEQNRKLKIKEEKVAARNPENDSTH